MMDHLRRRAARVRGKVDYAKLHGAELQSDDEHQLDLGHLAHLLLTYDAYTTGSCCKATPADITGEFIHTGFDKPVIVPPSSAAVQQLGMVLPPPTGLTVPEIAKVLGYDKEVAIFSVASHGDGPRWNLLQWLQYWCTRQGPQEREMEHRRKSVTSLDDEADSRDAKRREWEAKAKGIKVGAWVPRGISAESRRRLFQASLPIPDSFLEDAILSPRAVRDSDLVERFWPAHPSEDAEQQRPSVALQLSMAPAGSFCNFRLGPGGASTWVHVISGKKVFALLPPTSGNLAAYVSWASAARHAGVFLPEHTQGCVRVQIPAGASFFIPAGWVFAEATPVDCVAVGGHFLHAGAMTTQLQVSLIEEHLALRRQLRFPQFYQVLWYTAANYARRLMELCPLDPEEARKRAAQKSEARRAAGAAAAAEQAAKAAAARIASADRKARLQAAAARTSPAETQQQLPGSGSRRAKAESGGAGWASRQAWAGAALQRRQRRVSQRMQEAMEDPEADFGNGFDVDRDGGGDAPPVRSSRRLSGRFQDGSASGSEDIFNEDVDEDEESSEEELRAMANIRRRRQRLATQAAPPRVRLRTGARAAAAAQQATPPKLRIKYSAGAAAAQPPPDRSAERAGKGRAKLRLEDDVDDDVVGAEARVQPARQPSRATSLKLKLKFSEGGGSIPQVDGADDTEEEALHAEAPFERRSNEQAVAEDVARQTARADARDATADAQMEGSLDAPRGASGAAAADAAGAHEPAAPNDLASAGAAATQEHEEGAAVDDVSKERGSALPAGAQQTAPGSSDDQAAARAKETQEAGALDGSGAEPHHADAASEGIRAASQGKQLKLKQGPPAAETQAPHESTVGPEAPLLAAAAPQADGENPPADDQGIQLASGAGPENEHAVNCEAAKQRGPRPLLEQERAGVPALVHALRRWLRELGGHAPNDLEDPESLLDEMEVCLAAMEIPLAAVAVPVDFDALPAINPPKSSPLGELQVLPEDSAGEGTGLQGQSDDDPLEEDPQEELGDSTLEAQARGGKRGTGSNLGGRGSTRKKPSVRDRLTKKLRIK